MLAGLDPFKRSVKRYKEREMKKSKEIQSFVEKVDAHVNELSISPERKTIVFEIIIKKMIDGEGLALLKTE